MMKAITLKASCGITGFESVCQELRMLDLSLNDMIIHPSSTFFATANTNSLEQIGIYAGDLLVVDRGVTANTGDVVVANYNGESDCRIFDGRHRLLKAKSNMAPIRLDEVDDLIIDGVVSTSVRPHRKLPVAVFESDSLDKLIVHQPATFLAIASGSSLEQVGIFDGDLLIVDRALTAMTGDVIVAVFNNEFVAKVLDRERRLLLSPNSSFGPVKIDELDSFSLEGVVSSSIRLHRTAPMPLGD